MFVVVAAACLAWAFPVGAQPLVARPYVQKVTTDAVTIMWISEAAVSAEVILKSAGNVVARKLVGAVEVGEVRFGGLQPDTVYDYLVMLGARKTPLTGQFCTFPVHTAEFVFAIYGDSRSDPTVYAKVVRAVLREPGVRFVLHTGDLVTNGGEQSQWAPMFFSPSAPLIANIPLYPVLGNHESNSPYYFKYFNLPGNERWYSFDLNSERLHIIALDSCTDFAEGSDQYKWLVSDLLTNRADFTFIVMHHPPFTSGPHGAVGLDGGLKETPMSTARRVIPALAKRFRITAVFAGHDHAYERSVSGGVTYIVTGGGGAGLYSAPNRAQNQFSKLFYSGYNYCVVKIAGDKALLIAHTPDGKVLDIVDL